MSTNFNRKRKATDNAVKECRYASGDCPHGANCRYVHTKTAVKECRYASGDCPFGANCRYAHTKPRQLKKTKGENKAQTLSFTNPLVNDAAPQRRFVKPDAKINPTKKQMSTSAKSFADTLWNHMISTQAQKPFFNFESKVVRGNIIPQMQWANMPKRWADHTQWGEIMCREKVLILIGRGW